ncbi:hypothetical protein M0R45_035687 [Rubus argutus]|uniref:Uncharacterized protein n=1 Tax=Rubus argutus TaxID=59490 RepID=A0AAW1VYB4_RUBAR
MRYSRAGSSGFTAERGARASGEQWLGIWRCGFEQSAAVLRTASRLGIAAAGNHGVAGIDAGRGQRRRDGRWWRSLVIEDWVTGICEVDEVWSGWLEVLRGRGGHRLWFCLVRLKKLPWFEVGFTAEAVWWINYAYCRFWRCTDRGMGVLVSALQIL